MIHCFREGESIVVSTRTRVSRSNDSVIYCWIPSSCIAALFAVYSLVHAAILTDGFLKTCTQYRGYLVRVINLYLFTITILDIYKKKRIKNLNLKLLKWEHELILLSVIE